jgi:4-hydroxy-tetrahydrodipicolinate synthase
MRTDFHGIHPILYAFFDAEGRVLRDPIRAQVEAAVRHGAQGVAVLGLATETNKLDTSERRQILEWTAEALGGRLPLAVTVAEPSVHGQAAFVRVAKEAGAGWVILQPPAVSGLTEAELLRFFGSVAASTDLPVAIQNAPQYLSAGLSNAALRELNRQHPNVCLLKGEAPAQVIERLVAETEGVYRVFNGRGGMELPECLRAGCVGMIPAPECFDVQVEIYALIQRGDARSVERAEALYRDVLPLIVFLMSSIDTFICYGKRILGRRLGIDEVFDRAPAQRPSAFGLRMAERLSSRLGPL